eukprot:m.302937 g.302937  ORF g.302937 m.302937 type:complete len:61 (-) comp20156_c0_seq8:1563-1745(-)
MHPLLVASRYKRAEKYTHLGQKCLPQILQKRFRSSMENALLQLTHDGRTLGGGFFTLTCA